MASWFFVLNFGLGLSLQDVQEVVVPGFGSHTAAKEFPDGMANFEVEARLPNQVSLQSLFNVNFVVSCGTSSVHCRGPNNFKNRLCRIPTALCSPKLLWLTAKT